MPRSLSVPFTQKSKAGKNHATALLFPVLFYLLIPTEHVHIYLQRNICNMFYD